MVLIGNIILKKMVVIIFIFIKLIILLVFKLPKKNLMH